METMTQQRDRIEAALDRIEQRDAQARAIKREIDELIGTDAHLAEIVRDIARTVRDALRAA